MRFSMNRLVVSVVAAVAALAATASPVGAQYPPNTSPLVTVPTTTTTTTTTAPPTSTTTPPSTTTVPPTVPPTTDAPTIDVAVDTGAEVAVPADAFTVEVRCVVPEVVEFAFLDQTAVATCQADAAKGFSLSNVVFNGTAVAQFQAPPQSGTYAVTARLTQTGITLESTVTVVAPSGIIPATGAGDSSRSVALLAAGLAVAGVAMVLTARGRRSIGVI